LHLERQLGALIAQIRPAMVMTQGDTLTALRERVRAAGFAPGREWWDYGTSAPAPAAQFFTLEASRAGPPSA
jgi:hypothetical protein